MYVYSVIEVNLARSNEELKVFSSMVKALTFIEEMSGTISLIMGNRNKYKEYCSEAEWAKILLSEKGLDNKLYVTNNLPSFVVGYQKKKKKVY